MPVFPMYHSKPYSTSASLQMVSTSVWSIFFQILCFLQKQSYTLPIQEKHCWTNTEFSPTKFVFNCDQVTSCYWEIWEFGILTASCRSRYRQNIDKTGKSADLSHDCYQRHILASPDQSNWKMSPMVEVVGSGHMNARWEFEIDYTYMYIVNLMIKTTLEQWRKRSHLGSTGKSNLCSWQPVLRITSLDEPFSYFLIVFMEIFHIALL